MRFSCILCIFLFIIIIIDSCLQNFREIFIFSVFFSVFSTLYSFSKNTEKNFQFQCFICFSFSKKFQWIFQSFSHTLRLPLMLLQIFTWWMLRGPSHKYQRIRGMHQSICQSVLNLEKNEFYMHWFLEVGIVLTWSCPRVNTSMLEVAIVLFIVKLIRSGMEISMLLSTGELKIHLGSDESNLWPDAANDCFMVSLAIICVCIFGRFLSNSFCILFRYSRVCWEIFPLVPLFCIPSNAIVADKLCITCPLTIWLE